ncbi:hypothetical protein SLEP1_g27798 [Rubroshorea leprosula]|uniref:Uncharacterized protein n=1 Tax=Rubroshorea leprosula TaxID=152421 RepID=A0AAV5K183_9ROSI|nr:hypothetical protein SLEP1_g27798 [Rubroshorea leprosula]
MQLSLCTGDSAKLLGMGVPSNVMRLLKKRLLGMQKMEQSQPGALSGPQM